MKTKKLKIENLTIGELIEMGARIDVHFHRNNDLQTAYNKLKPFTNHGAIEKYSSSDGAVWVKIQSDELQFTAFL